MTRVSTTEFCPCCGEFVRRLDDETGWCAECSGTLAVACVNCGKYFEKDTPHRTLCPYCRNERWLERNSDLMEDLILRHGLAPRRAQLEIYRFNRPLCVSCGNPIRGGRTSEDGSQATHFCTTSVECKRWQRRYRTLREKFQRKGVLDAPKLALAEVSAEIYVKRHQGEKNGQLDDSEHRGND